MDDFLVCADTENCLAGACKEGCHVIVYSVKDVLNGPRSIQARALIKTAREIARKRAREKRSILVVRKFQPSSVKEGRVIHVFFKSAQSPPGIRARSSDNT